VRHSRRYTDALAGIDREHTYTLEEAVQKLKETATADFDETIEAAFLLGIKPSQVNVRGTCSLPHGSGKTVSVLAFAKGEALSAAEEAGADYVGGEDFAEKISDGWLEFDKVVASPDMMRVVGKLGKVLGPRGLMPSPKAGTVTNEVGKIIGEIKKGMVEFRTDRFGVAHCVVGKASFEGSMLKENLVALAAEIIESKPEEGLKGRYFSKVVISSTMGPGIVVDPQELMQEAERTA